MSPRISRRWCSTWATSRAVVITAAGWRVVDEPPVRFRRTAATGALAESARDGNLNALWDAVNVAAKYRPLVLAVLVAELIPNLPHPVVAITGEQGTGKSTATRRLASIIDPSPAQLRKAPRDVETWTTAPPGPGSSRWTTYPTCPAGSPMRYAGRAPGTRTYARTGAGVDQCQRELRGTEHGDNQADGRGVPGVRRLRVAEGRLAVSRCRKFKAHRAVWDGLYDQYASGPFANRQAVTFPQYRQSSGRWGLRCLGRSFTR